MEKWNYYLLGNLSDEKQFDFNQTLITKLNYIMLKSNRKTNTIEIPKNLKSLIETLVLYENEKINNKYLVKFIKKHNNIIKINDLTLEIENYWIKNQIMSTKTKEGRITTERLKKSSKFFESGRTIKKNDFIYYGLLLKKKDLLSLISFHIDELNILYKVFDNEAIIPYLNYIKNEK